MFDKDFLKDTLTQVIAGVIISTGLILGFWNYVREAFIWIYNSLSDPLTIPEYMIFITFILGAGSFYLGKLITDYFQKTYKDYRKDDFLGVTWKWHYESDKEVSKRSIEAICPDCNSRMNIIAYDSKDDKTRTCLICTNAGCENSRIFSSDDYEYDYAGSQAYLYERISNKVDRKLREKGLKL